MKNKLMKEVICAVVAQELEEIVSQLEELQEFVDLPEEEAKQVDIDRAEVFRKVSQELGLPVCMVNRVTDCVIKTLLDMGCNAVRFEEVDDDEE